ncbi:DUF881 domain-containing protein [Luteimicrobium subarcticum]|uniref:Uncharacterized protein YlxW (UPF0749 family) n=1 Tax=Luteimicrobium subarcticum TaxID=620910 RepID=A0A2M8W3U5_9MICO|nr:DUF881 domain-containing protein [Luteimicrobium subarcticum]PJI85585.1 uncharacterized protein YlxW (UPF0749 family) [Luteimicrobium subarcticum]
MSTPPRTTPRTRRPDESMTLITEVMNHPLDPGYAEAAARRDTRTRRPAGHLAYGLVAVALGTLATVAVISLRAPSPAVVAARDVLVKQITARQAHADQLTRDITDASDTIAALQSQALAERYPGLLKTIEDDSVASGAAAVTGPGLVVTLTDADDAVDTDGTVDADKRVQDSDLQLVVNALWASGAEAISINGQRLTATTAIRSAGSAVLVDFVGLASPYTVDAIGDPDDLHDRFAASTATDQLDVLQESYGIRTTTKTADHLALAGGGASTLYSATPLD